MEHLDLLPGAEFDVYIPWPRTDAALQTKFLQISGDRGVESIAYGITAITPDSDKSRQWATLTLQILRTGQTPRL